jgi:TPR repeat protein
LCRYAERFKDDAKFAQALHWFTLAAEQGGVDAAAAQMNVGELHFKGIGTARNELEGIKWYVRAANAGEVAAQKKLNAMLNRPTSAWTPMAETASTYDTLLRVSR